MKIKLSKKTKGQSRLYEHSIGVAARLKFQRSWQLSELSSLAYAKPQNWNLKSKILDYQADILDLGIMKKLVLF